MLDIRPMEFDFIFTCRLAFNYYHKLLIFLQIIFRHKTRINLLFLAYFEGCLLYSSIDEQRNLQKLALTLRLKLKKEILLLQLSYLEDMESLPLIQIAIFSLNYISHRLIRYSIILACDELCI